MRNVVVLVKRGWCKGWRKRDSCSLSLGPHFLPERASRVMVGVGQGGAGRGRGGADSDEENCSDVINLKIGMNVFGKNMEKPPKPVR